MLQEIKKIDNLNSPSIKKYIAITPYTSYNFELIQITKE